MKGKIRGREKDRRERMRGVEGEQDGQMGRIVIYSQVLLHTRMEEVYTAIYQVYPLVPPSPYSTLPFPYNYKNLVQYCSPLT